MGEFDNVGRGDLIRMICEGRVKLVALQGDLHVEKSKRLDTEASLTEAQAAGSRAVTAKQELRERIASYVDGKGHQELASDIRSLIAEHSGGTS